MDVTIQGLNLSYGTNRVVRDLDLHIEDGETVVLLGKSGCGKTTTMRCVAGLEVPNEGSVRIGGKVVFDAAARTNVPSYKRNVGMVFQSYAVWPHKTVIENVGFPLMVKKLGRAKVRSRALEVLELVGLVELADRSASMLSGGQMQRVALARSIAMSPSVLLLDEPLSNLDAVLRDDLRIELRRIQAASGLTSVYVTHDQSEALALADRIAIMQDGRIMQLAPPADIYSRPASASIARFLGISNVFPVESRASDGSYRLADIPMAVHAADEAQGRVSVCIRPDAFRVLSAEDSLDPTRTSEANNWTGVVTVAVFQGRSTRTQVKLDEGLTIDVVVESEDRALLIEGSRVRVTVDPRDVFVLPDEVDAINVVEEGK